MNLIPDDHVLVPLDDHLTETDAMLVNELAKQAAVDLDPALAVDPTGPKRDSIVVTPAAVRLMSVPTLNGIDMPALRAKVIARAVSQIGTKENPPYSNIIWAWVDCKPAWQRQPWCAAAVTSWWGRAGVDLRKVLANPYYCPYLEAEGKRVKAWRAYGSGYTPKQADLILYGRGLATHVGISYPGPGEWSGYRTIEGNTSASNAGSQTNGDGCYLRYRDGSFIRGWIDMEVAIAAWVKEGKITVEEPKLVPAPASRPVTSSVSKPTAVKGVKPKLSVRAARLSVTLGLPTSHAEIIRKALGLPSRKGKPFNGSERAALKARTGYYLPGKVGLTKLLGNSYTITD